MITIEQLATDFLEAYERKDISAISKMLSDEVIVRDWNLEVTGKDEALSQFKKNFEDGAGLKIQIRKLYISESAVAAEIEIQVGSVESLRVIDVIEFDERYRITAIISYKGL